MNLVFSTMLASYPSFFFAPRRSGECMHLHVYSWAASWVTAILLRIWKICIDGPQKQKQLMDAWSQCGAEGSYRRREWKETEGDRNILIVKNVYKSWGCIMIECFWWSESTCLSPIRIHPRSTNREEYTIHLKSGWKIVSRGVQSLLPAYVTTE